MSNKKMFLTKVGGLDPDVKAYFLANGVTNTSIVSEVNTFVLGLKSNGIYTKITALTFYFMGSAFSNKWNLINPLDTDASHRAVFNGTITHGSTGIIPNGSTGYVDTKVNSLSHINPTNNHYALYSRTNVQNDAFHGMAVIGLQTIQNYLRGSSYNNETRISNGNSNNSVIVTGRTSSIGFYINNRRTNTSLKLFKNGIQLGTEATAPSMSAQNYNLYDGARNLNGSPIGYDTRELSMRSIGEGFTDGEALIYSNLTQTLLTNLGIWI